MVASHQGSIPMLHKGPRTRAVRREKERTAQAQVIPRGSPMVREVVAQGRQPSLPVWVLVLQAPLTLLQV